MFELIRQLVNLYGATGREAGVADAVEALVKDHVDSIRRDALGNLICEKRGTDPDGKRIMLSAHMDHIGFIVVAVEKEGFLRVMPVGGVGLAVSRTRHVSFQNGVQGVIVQEPVREGETPAMKHMFIDIGAADETEALSMVSLGDVAVYANDCFRLGEHRVAAPAMDDRIACALLVSVMQALPQTRNTVIAVFSTQEEVGCRGAKTAAYSVEPDIGIALAVFWGFAFGFTPVGWSTWIARTLSDKAELAGGLTVAATQFAIGLAAAVGGFTYDNLGINGIFLAAAGISVMAALLIAVSFSLFARDTGHKA